MYFIDLVGDSSIFEYCIVPVFVASSSVSLQTQI